MTINACAIEVLYINCAGSVSMPNEKHKIGIKSPYHLFFL